MNWDAIATYIPYIISAIALILALRKQKHDEANIDAKTIQTFADTTATVGEQYKTLQSDFKQYKEDNERIINELRKEIDNLTQKNAVLSTTLAKETDSRKRTDAELSKLQKDNQALKTTNMKLAKWVEQLCTQLKDNGIIPICGDTTV